MHQQNLAFFCENCRKIICDLCKEEEHKDHEIKNNFILSPEEAEKVLKIAEENNDKFKGLKFAKNYLLNTITMK